MENSDSKLKASNSGKGITGSKQLQLEFNKLPSAHVKVENGNVSVKEDFAMFKPINNIGHSKGVWASSVIFNFNGSTSSKTLLKKTACFDLNRNSFLTVKD